MAHDKKMALPRSQMTVGRHRYKAKLIKELRLTTAALDGENGAFLAFEKSAIFCHFFDDCMDHHRSPFEGVPARLGSRALEPRAGPSGDAIDIDRVDLPRYSSPFEVDMPMAVAGRHIAEEALGE